MHILSRRKINEFIRTYPDSGTSLNNWYRIVKKANYNSFSELKQHFSSADYVEGFIVFNISGNRYRLITAIHFDRKKVYIRHILTHQEYDQDKWKE